MPKIERLRDVEAADLAMRMLKWMQEPRCPKCDGRGHPTIPNTPTLDTTRGCLSCRGTGVRPLERLVRREHAEHVRWLAGRVDRACAEVFGDAGRMLRWER